MLLQGQRRAIITEFFYLKIDFFGFYLFALKKKLYICTISVS